MWRPKGWKNPFPRYRDSQGLLELTKAELEAEAAGVLGESFEAGADAMLEALKQQGEMPKPRGEA